VILSGILASLACLSFLLLLWQWLAARRFPLHRRVADKSFAPAVTLLKPLKGCDATTADSLRSWLTQDFAGEVQILFGVTSAADPACAVVRNLLAAFPQRDAQLVVCPERLGANSKVSKLAQLEPLAKHDIVIVTDADVRAPADLLTNVVALLRKPEVGLVNCLYQLANPTTPAMRWEAVAVNADFWSQVLQSRSLRPLDFALGAVMAVKREALQNIGGFAALTDYLADDYELGNRVARAGWRIELCPVVVECWSAPMRRREVWRHQLRWARTIRACQPVAYFFSILSNATLWPLLWLLAASPAIQVATGPGDLVLSLALPKAVLLGGLCLIVRMLVALDLQHRLTRSYAHLRDWWLVPAKDVLQAALWLLAFTGRRIDWRGERFRLMGDGRLVKD